MLEPLGKFILAEPIKLKFDREEKTETGIILSVQTDDRPDLAVAKAKVTATGDEVKKIRTGDVVLYPYFSGNKVLIPGKDPRGTDDKELHLIYEDDVLAKENK